MEERFLHVLASKAMKRWQKLPGWCQYRQLWRLFCSLHVLLGLIAVAAHILPSSFLARSGARLGVEGVEAARNLVWGLEFGVWGSGCRLSS